jgi:hypothetical protein
MVRPLLLTISLVTGGAATIATPMIMRVAQDIGIDAGHAASSLSTLLQLIGLVVLFWVGRQTQANSTALAEIRAALFGVQGRPGFMESAEAEGEALWQALDDLSQGKQPRLARNIPGVHGHRSHRPGGGGSALG